MTHSLRRLSLGLLLALPLMMGCRQGDGDRCQLDSDCADTLRCVFSSGATIATGGICRSSTTDAGGTTDMAVAPLPDLSTGDGGPDMAADAAATPDLAADDAAVVDLTILPDLVVIDLAVRSDGGNGG